MRLIEGAIPIIVDGEDGPLLVLAHGAGGSRDQRTIVALSTELVSRGIRVARFNFRYRDAGRNMPDPMPKLILEYRDVVARVRASETPGILLVGGHSMGGRAASMMVAEGAHVDGLVLFAYPLHPAGKPEKLRDAHLPGIDIPTLCFNGTRDELCTPDLMKAVLAKLDPQVWTMHWLEGADHSYAAPKSAGRTKSVMSEIGETVAAWVQELAISRPTSPTR